MNTDVINWIFTISAWIGVIQQIYWVIIFAIRKRKTISTILTTQNIIRDSLIIILNILFGFLIPIFSLWYEWNESFSGIKLMVQIISWYLIISNILLWYMILYILKILRDSGKSKNL